MKKWIIAGSVLLIGIAVVILLLFNGSSLFEKKVKKPDVISVMFDTTFLRKAAGQDQLAAEYKRLTGIELRVFQPDHSQYNDKLLIKFAGGDVPDVVEIQPEHPEVYLQMASKGEIIPLDKYIATSNAFKHIDPQYLNTLKFKGHIYATPLNSGGGCPTYIRKDWLDNLGLAIPRTYNELYAVAKAFTFNDPDQNGKADTYGFILPSIDNPMYLQDFYQGADYGFLQQHGKWVDGFTQPEFKKALQRIRQAYRDKIIDPEMFTNQTGNARENFLAGKGGIFSYWAGDWGRKLHYELRVNFPNADVVAIPAIKESHYLNRIGPMLAITKSCKNPEAVFRYINEYMYDGATGQMLFTHGVKGVHWTVKQGKYVQLPNLDDPNSLFTKSYIEPALSLRKIDDPFKLDPKTVASVKALHSRVVQLQLPLVTRTYLKNAADIIALKKEIIMKTIMGLYTVDEGMRIYKKESQKLGVPRILQEANAK